MINRLKSSSLFKNSMIYTFLQLFNKGLPFLILPILTRYLSSDDYGLIASYNTFLAFVTIFVGLSVGGALGVNYFKIQKEELKLYIGNIFNILVVSTLITIMFVALFHTQIYNQIQLPLLWMIIAIIVSFFQNITGLNLTLWRCEQKAKNFALYEISESLLNVAITLILVVSLKYAWEGRVGATAIATIVFGTLSFYIIFKRGYAKLNINNEYLKDALKFGVPLVPHHLALWLRSGIDIILITSLIGLSATGVYAVGFQLGAVVGIVAVAFNNAYSPYLFEKLKNITDEEKSKIVKFTYLYFIAIFLLSLIISSLFILLLPYIVGEEFQDASKYIVFIAIAHSFSGMYMMVVNYIFYEKKTHLLSMVTLISSILHLIISFLFIKKFGAIGAAYASIISFFITFIWVWYLSNKVYKMPWFGAK